MVFGVARQVPDEFAERLLVDHLPVDGQAFTDRVDVGAVVGADPQPERPE